MEGCEGLLKSPVFLLKIGFFIDLAWKMNQSFNLKLFLSISAGAHFLAFSLLSILLPDLKITKLPLLNIEVSLLAPAREEERLKVRSLPAPVKSVEFGVQHKEEPLKIVEKKGEETKAESPVKIDEEKKVSHVEKAEVVPSKKEQEPLATLPLQAELKEVSISESKPSPLTGEQKEIGSKQEEKVVVASLGNTVPQTSSSEKPPMAMKSLPLSDRDILFAYPRYAENTKPLYPREAKKKGYEGEVLLRVEVLSNGRVGEIEVKRSSGHEALDRSAMTAVKQWKFIPARKGETPVAVWVNIPVAFQLR